MRLPPRSNLRIAKTAVSHASSAIPLNESGNVVLNRALRLAQYARPSINRDLIHKAAKEHVKELRNGGKHREATRIYKTLKNIYNKKAIKILNILANRTTTRYKSLNKKIGNMIRNAENRLRLV